MLMVGKTTPLGRKWHLKVLSTPDPSGNIFKKKEELTGVAAAGPEYPRQVFTPARRLLNRRHEFPALN
jgi:hypothetical protein